MALNGFQVLIAGGGIAGLAAALALRARGASVTVLERAAAFAEVGAGLQISPNGGVVLDALGLGPALDAVSLRAGAVQLRDFRTGRAVLRLDLARHAGDLAFRFVHRADLIAVLADAARDAGVTLRTGAEIADLRDGSRPAVQLAGGGWLEADLVIGADGLQSRARAVLNGKAAPFFTGQVAWRALVPGAVLPPEAQVFMGPGRHLVCYPLRDGWTANLVAVQERRQWAGEGWSQRDDPAALRAAFADFGGPVPALLASVTEVYLWGLFRHPVAPVWHGAGLALVGDAAHPTLPFLAQGANMALEDVWVLASALDAPGTLADRLARYQDLRRARVVRVIETANANARRYHLRQPLVRGAAHLALGLAGAVAPARVVGQFDWLYRHDVTAG